MSLKTGQPEYLCLLEKVIKKYEKSTGIKISQNTSPAQYAGIAETLSEFTKELPFTAESRQHDPYSRDLRSEGLDYPNRKYDITGTQLRALVMEYNDKAKKHILDACYIYLYGVGRKGFALNPIDPDLLEEEKEAPINELDTLRTRGGICERENQDLRQEITGKTKKHRKLLFTFQCVALALGLFLALGWYGSFNRWYTIKKDLNILPYQPTPAEIDSLQGIWLCYTASPQARLSDPNRYHLVVFNVVDIKYKDGYFVFKRYGASFDHLGYMQFEAPWLVSVYSYVKNNKDSIQSPRHSLMPLNKGGPFINVISASWSFDTGDKNQIIGIREVYVKQGKEGPTDEIINSIENAGCKCKIVQWQNPDKGVTTFYLKNQLLDTLAETRLRKLLNEKSILLREPQDGLILADTSVHGPI